jgi:hypothetical protein
MRRNFVKAMLAASTLLWLAPMVASAQTPKREAVREIARDLTVELRQVQDGDQDNPSAGGGAYTVGTTHRGADFAPQQVRVRSGEKASLHINQSMPMQWVQKVETQSASLSAGSASASSKAGGVTQAITWMESGQSLTVTPHWAGAKLPVKVEVEVHTAAVNERTGSDLPGTSSQRYSTTVSLPLNQWVTIATTGRASQPANYSSAGSTDTRRLIQLRVSTD